MRFRTSSMGEHVAWVARFVEKLRALGLKRIRYHVQITGTWPWQPMPMRMPTINHPFFASATV